LPESMAPGWFDGCHKGAEPIIPGRQIRRVRRSERVAARILAIDRLECAIR